MMNETSTTISAATTYDQLNGPVCAGLIRVTPDGDLAVSVAGRAILFDAKKGATDVTDISVPVSNAATHGITGKLKKGQLFFVGNKIYQAIEDNGSDVKAFDFDGNVVVNIVPETLPTMGNVRAIAVVYTFGTTSFQMLRMKALASKDYETARDLKKKEILAAQQAGKEVDVENDDIEKIIGIGDPAIAGLMLQMKTQQENAAIATALLAQGEALKAIAAKLAEVKPASSN